MHRISGVTAVVIGVLTCIVPTLILIQAVTFLFIVPPALGILCIGLGIGAYRTDGKFSNYVGWIAAVLMLIAFILPFGIITYCDRSGYPIAFVIPEGYRGPVRLLIDRKRGIDVPLKEGRYTYHFPANGTLLIKDDSPFCQWHTMTAVYANGKLIPFEDDNLPPKVVTLHSLVSVVKTEGDRREEYLQAFLGTEEEFRAYVDPR